LESKRRLPSRRKSRTSTKAEKSFESGQKEDESFNHKEKIHGRLEKRKLKRRGLVIRKRERGGSERQKIAQMQGELKSLRGSRCKETPD